MFANVSKRLARQLSTQIVAHNSRIASLEQADRALHIKWEDGEQASFSYVWLRDWAPSSRPLHLSELTLGVAPKSAELTPDGEQLDVQWPPWTNTTYSSDWLRQQAQSLKAAELSASLASQGHGCRALTTVEAFSNLSQPDNILKALTRDGVVSLTWNNDVLGTVRRLLGLEGSIVHEWEHECTVTGLHTGCAHMDNVPRYMLIKPINIDNNIGTFQLVDGLHVAHECWLRHPDDFGFLAATTINYSDRAQPEAEPVKHSVIKLDSHGNIKQVVFNNAYRSPSVPPSQMQTYYRALKTFNQLCYKRAVDLKIQVGELLLIDNHRILHGNTAFNTTPHKLNAKVMELYIGNDNQD